MRAYTAWVIQSGKGKDAAYLDAKGQWWGDIRRALQLARRTDARNVIAAFEEGTLGEARPVEKTFG